MGKSSDNTGCKPIPAKKKTTSKTWSSSPKKSSGPQRILDVILSIEMQGKGQDVSRKTVCSLSGVKPSTFAVTISGMKKNGLIEYNKDTIRLTKKGRSMASYDENESPMDNTQMLDELKRKHKLGGKAGQLFDLLKDGHIHDRSTLPQDIGCDNKNTLAVMLSNVKKTGIITYDRHTIQLSVMCFPFGRPES